MSVCQRKPAGRDEDFSGNRRSERLYRLWAGYGADVRVPSGGAGGSGDKRDGKRSGRLEPSGSAGGGRRNVCRFGNGRRCVLSVFPSGALSEYRKTWGCYFRTAAAYESPAALFSAAQPHYQRTLAGGAYRGGEGAQRLADYGGRRSGTGKRCFCHTGANRRCPQRGL